MPRYLIDIRLMGSVKQQIRNLSSELEEEFGLKNKLVIPHITLAGPFSTDDEARLKEDFARVCSDQKIIPKYDIGGYGFFDNTRVVHVIIVPDEELRQFRYRLAQAVLPYCSMRDYDRDSAEDFRFHATLAMKLDWVTYYRIRWHFRKQDPVVFHHHPVRVTLLKNSTVLCEYDFVQERMLSPAQVRSKATFMRDLDIMRAWGDSSDEWER